jgi:hypothetical protein
VMRSGRPISVSGILIILLGERKSRLHPPWRARSHMGFVVDLWVNPAVYKLTASPPVAYDPPKSESFSHIMSHGLIFFLLSKTQDRPWNYHSGKTTILP